MPEAESVFNPFPGLRSFESDETHLFFGRDGQSDELLSILARNRFVSVVGTSGSGKSSLVRAGLLPALERGFMAGAGSSWRIVTMRPGASSIENLATALNENTAPEVGELDLNARQILIDTTLRRNSFGLTDAARFTRMDPRENLLVVVDQFEEIFRLTSERARTAKDEEPTAFVRQLLEAVHQIEVPIYVAITMRSDFLGDCAKFRDLPETLNHAQYLIPRMTREQRRQAIEGPVAVGGATITPRLVQRLLNDVGDEPDQLPILQHALMRTWDAWQRKGNLDAAIDLEHYESIGGMADALSRHADEAYDELDKHGREIARQLFQCLSEKGPDNRETRRPTRLSEICAVAEAPLESVVPVIDCFRSSGRTFLVPPESEKLAENSIIDISHESLIRLWSRLRQWTDEEAESAANYRRLAYDAIRHKAGRAALWRDPGLALALEWKENSRPNAAWANRYAPGFADAMDFLERSRKASERAKRLRYSLVAGSVTLALVFLGLSVIVSFLYQKANQTSMQLRATSAQLQARQLVDSAELIDGKQPEKLDFSALLAVESAKRMPLLDSDKFLRKAATLLEKPAFEHRFAEGVHAISFSPDSQHLAVVAGETAAVLQTTKPDVIGLKSPGGLVDAVSFSPDGRFVATGSFDQNARVFEAATGKEISKLHHDGAVTAVSFSPDGRLVATGSADKTARVFDAATGKEVSRLAHQDVVGAVAFSPGGKFVATASQDKTARVFDAATGKEISHLTHDLPVRAVTFSSDGRFVATGSVDSTARVFEAATGKEVSRFRHGNEVNAVAFSPDGRFIATGSADGTARVFELAAGTEKSRLTHGDSVLAVAFSPDGTFVGTGSADKTARVFEAATGKEVWRFAHDDVVPSVAFSPDGRLVATGSFDKTVRMFGTTKKLEVALDLQDNLGHRTPTGKIAALAFSPDGDRVAAGGQDKTDKTVRVFAAATGKVISQLAADDQVLAVAFSPDGRYIATGSHDGTACVFELATQKMVSPRLRHDSAVDAVAFSPDGRMVATGSRDQTARVFEWQSGRKILRVPHSDVVDAVAFSPDGRYIATGSYDHSAQVFDVATGKPVSPRLKNDSIVDAVAFSPDGHFVATGSTDRTARVFEVATRRALRCYRKHRPDRTGI